MRERYELSTRQDKICGARDEDYENPVLAAKDEALGFLLGDMDSPAESITQPPTTDAEIDELVKVVKADYEALPEYSGFGDPNWKIRDAIIEILEWAKGSE